MMRITFDRGANAAYIYLAGSQDGSAVETYQVEKPHLRGMINLDFDKTGRLIGVEVINATKLLPHSLLETAERI